MHWPEAGVGKKMVKKSGGSAATHVDSNGPQAGSTDNYRETPSHSTSQASWTTSHNVLATPRGIPQ